MIASLTGARLFIGATLEHESDRALLQAIMDQLARRADWSVILANVNLAERQYDFIVCSEHLTATIEAKSYARPIQGSTNGDWSMLVPGGTTKRMRNAYLQALNQKNRLHTEMQKTDAQLQGYPLAALVAVPAFPKGSRIPQSDLKVSLLDISNLARVLDSRSGAAWSQARWIAFAKELGLQEVSRIEEAINPQLFEDAKLCEAYAVAYRQTYGPVAAELCEDIYRTDSGEVSCEQLIDALFFGGEDIVITGPAGCGKSLLAAQIGIDSMGHHHVPITIAAKEFEGRLGVAIDSEAALLGVRSARSLVAAAKRSGRTLLLAIDGYNETSETERVRLTRSVSAFARRHATRVVVTTQIPLARADLLPLKQVTVSRPNRELKQRISGTQTKDIPSANVSDLLDSVSSGLEAKLVGAVGASMPAQSSRFAIYDEFLRSRLEPEAREAILFLTEFARVLSDRVSFSLSVREYERVAGALKVSRAAMRVVETSGLVAARGGRMSFVHELFMAAFEAEAAIRGARGEIAKLELALRSPRFAAVKSLIVGGLEDFAILSGVLERTCDEDVWKACAAGECGPMALRIVRAEVTQLLSRFMSEIDQVSFALSDQGLEGVELECESEFPDRYVPLIGVLARDMAKGLYFDEVLAVVGALDSQIQVNIDRLRPLALEKKQPLRSPIFSCAYVMSRKLGVSQLSYFIHSGGLWRTKPSGPAFESALLKAWGDARSAGQFYLLLALTRQAGNYLLALPNVIRLLEDWKHWPYHLKLDILDLAQYMGEAQEPARSRLIGLLEGLFSNDEPLLNSSIFDALSGLGALQSEEEDHLGSVRSEISELLADSGSAGSDQRAYGIYLAQMDHPLAGAYCEAIEELSADQQNQLLLMAARGASPPVGFFLSPLLAKLGEAQLTEAVPVLASWAGLPNETDAFPQEAVAVFVNACCALGAMDAELPEGPPLLSAPAEALHACGELYFWASRKDLTRTQILMRAELAVQTLIRNETASLGAILLTSPHMNFSRRGSLSLVNVFPEMVLRVSRIGLENRHTQVGYFEHSFRADRDEVARFALQVIGELGGDEDLPALRHLADDPAIGTDAIQAIRNLEDRINSL
jgi:hypothetical protein